MRPCSFPALSSQEHTQKKKPPLMRGQGFPVRTAAPPAAPSLGSSAVPITGVLHPAAPNPLLEMMVKRACSGSPGQEQQAPSFSKIKRGGTCCVACCCHTATQDTPGANAQESWFSPQGQATVHQASRRRKFKAAHVSDTPGLSAVPGSEATSCSTVAQGLVPY